MSVGRNYILVSPVKDEEKYIEKTIQAVLKQTIRPSRWIIVDDGSRDRTYSIAEKYAQEFPWITLVRHMRDAARQPGSGIIRAFNVGYELVRNAGYDFIVKFDCDLDFPPDYFEQLIMRFEQNPQLGIASGIYLENSNGNWIPIKMPAYHAGGQTKMVRAKCFADIGGFVESRGWDTLDEIRARAMGWDTRHFEELFFYHLKLEGSGIGFLRTSKMHGEIYYLTGGGHLFFFLKFLDRLARGNPFFLGGMAMLWGYSKPYLTRRRRLVSDSEAKLYQRMLNRRITDRLSSILRSQTFRPRPSIPDSAPQLRDCTDQKMSGRRNS
jgi:poly-beta-1,6-N-acetyl-D-glucosamine synthase